MSKLANMLNMILLLKRNGKMKINELSYEIGVSPRQIRSYYNDLEQSGIYIKSETGKNGGYSLEDSDFKIPFQITLNESDKLLMQILSTSFNLNVKEAYDQFKFFVTSEEFKHIFTKSSSIEEIRHLIIIHKAINGLNVLKIDYLLNSGKRIEKTIYPYFTFQRYDNWYLLGFDSYHNKAIRLKLGRMISIESLDKQFKINQNLYKLEKTQIEKNIGVYNTGKSYEVILELDNELQWAIEDVFNNNVEVLDKHINSITVKLHTSSLKEIRRSILFLGKKCKVIKPKALQQLLLEELKSMSERYEE